ncbi:MAG TPA: T9SS type A sorting domain-containing protein [Puia sp.]|jgi:hypothetical protein|nr:T9SS type A sorting domain-containing protein [Puia sp.]
MKKFYIPTIFFLLGAFSLIFFHPLKKDSENRLGQVNELERNEEVLARIKQEVLMTKDPLLGYVPIERLEAARKQWTGPIGGNTKGSSSPLGSSANILGAGLTWNERGPNNIGGRCRAILVDKADVSGNTVLAGSVSGGLWRSTNFLNATPSWTVISSVSANLAITTLAQDPSNSSVMYAGTGEGYFNLDAVRGLGIYKSTDGGITWALLSSTTTGGTQGNDFGYVQKVNVYTNGDVYASGISAKFCNAGGVLKSTDGGTTWTRVIGKLSGALVCSNAVDFNGYDIEFSFSGDIYATVIDNSAIFLASPGNPAGKIYRSPAGATVGDAGTWTNIAPPAGSGKYWQRVQVACSPSNNNRLYAIFQGTGNGIGSIQRSDDAGSTWTDITNANLWCDGGSNNGTDFSRQQAWYDLTIAVNPGNDATVYAGGVDIFTTSNSGTSWSQLTQWAAGCTSLPYVHADIHNITFLPGSSSGFIVGCDGGVFYTANSGGSFVSKDQSLNVTQYYAAAIHPTQGSNYMLAGAQDNGSHVFNNSGINTVTTATGGDGAFCFIDQSSPNFQLTSYTNAEYSRSTDGGTSFSTWSSSTNGRFINPADYDNTTQFLYCGYTDTRLRRIGTITSASPIGTSIIVSGANLQVSAVKVDPTTTDSVWVAFSTADDASSDQVPALYVIGGASTGTRTITQLTGLVLASGSYISSIDVEKGKASHLIVTVSNYGVASVWESKDKGTTWASLDNNGMNLPDVPVRWGLIVPSTANVGTGGPNAGIMLATELGVWSTTASNGTSTVWTQNSTTLGNVRTDMLKFRTSDNYLVVATHGRGLFSTNLLTSPLAVRYVSFTANAESNYDNLQWNVENEINEKGYDVEREYADENAFTKIGFVEAKKANSSNQYNFVDNTIDLGRQNVFYRLKQTDLDGNTTYSVTVMLTRKPSVHFVEYISVNGGNLFMRLNNHNNMGQINARILDMTGRMILNRDIAFQSQYMDISNLASGVYVLRLLESSSGAQFAQKFVKK